MTLDLLQTSRYNKFIQFKRNVCNDEDTIVYPDVRKRMESWLEAPVHRYSITTSEHYL